ncbi:hypothetical protein CP967_31375 [Streptomyces nitrosporeus]|uniref:Uncharacterized protein n=1 Tax=Streptomyces nitrosporeus TaxID=28894 RepID=A0A5J6FIS3_9ACTN|nr:hypothetical protein [Streptomyces nitrosporeus]QEU75871.1 hypothetical protein CP967_31375 [Streptomyces nitrosporeus]GGY88995.1 hypothetical protein GCM10010327_19690 [Streptomyces nitrosporeus]
MSDVKVGDRVEITQYRRNDDYGNGCTGVVLQIDTDDVPFLVKTDTGEKMWASEVRKLGATVTVAREALVTRAKELLADTPHTVTDIITMATFLAGE